MSSFTAGPPGDAPRLRDPQRRRLLAGAGAAAVLGLPSIGAWAAGPCGPWSAWQRFKSRFISGDGRVIDPMHDDQRTVSEGQAYAMMFALIGNDRGFFDLLLRWTRDNLARGDLGTHLPAWIWGKRKDGSWGVIDPNAATDADVWLAYALLEASRLWSEPAYRVQADALMALIAEREVMDLPRLGPTLMPAPHGFVLGDFFRLNPSYLALQPLRRFAAHTRDTLWPAVLASSRRVLLEAAPHGAAGDWIEWRPKASGFVADAKTGGIGSYDAIRVYLWAGMLHARDPDRRELLARYAPVSALFTADGRPPEHIDIAHGHARGSGPGGFSACFLPFFTASADFGRVAQQKFHLAAQAAVDEARYYDQVLRLWGEGWDAGRYGFAADGSLWTAWASGCAPA
jgi:endoglucanase